MKIIALLFLLFAALLVAGCEEKSTMEDPRIPEGVGGPPLKSATEIVKASSESPNPPAAESPAAESPAAESPAAESPAAESPAAESLVAESPVAESPVAESPVAESPIAEPSLSQSRPVRSVPPVQCCKWQRIMTFDGGNV